MGGVMKPMITYDREDQRVDRAVVDLGSGYIDFNDQARFDDLPESCIAQSLLFLSPKDIVRLACTSRAFRDAALSDLVWQAKLPNCYTETLAEAMEGPPASSSKKSIYQFLCHSVLLKDGHEAFWLDQATGGVCRSQGARALSVVWGDDQRYWSWLPVEGSSFAEVAYLKAVCWLEVNGHMECSLPVGTYTLSWRLSLAQTPVEGRSYIRFALDHVYGWSHKPVIFSLVVDGGEPILTEHRLDGDCWESEEAGSSSKDSGRRLVNEKWMEFDVGEFTVEEGDEGSGEGRVKLQYSLTEIKGGHWKSGMFLDGIVIRPSDLKPKGITDRGMGGEVGGSSSFDGLQDTCGIHAVISTYGEGILAIGTRDVAVT